MSYGPQGMNSLFYTKGGRIKSGIPHTTWSGGQPGSTGGPTVSRNQSIMNCFSTAQTGATLSAFSTNPQVSRARYKSSLDQLQHHCLHGNFK